MPTFIKGGIWSKRKDIPKISNGELNLNEFVENKICDTGYKSYSALFTQSGTNAPVVTIISNTLGLTLTWVRSTTGNYFGGNIASQCPDEKTVFITSNGGAFGIDPKQAYLWAFNSGASRVLNFNIKSIASTGVSTSVDWDSPKAILIEIRVYN